MPSAAPQKIGRYRIVGRLGKGAMAVVYRAHDDTMGRPVAIKVMMADLEEDPDQRSLLSRGTVRRPARAPNIITIFDMEDDGRPYIVMELLEGPTLGGDPQGTARLDHRAESRSDDTNLRGPPGRARLLGISTTVTSSPATWSSAKTAS